MKGVRFVWKQCRYSRATSSSPFFALTQRCSEKGYFRFSWLKLWVIFALFAHPATTTVCYYFLSSILLPLQSWHYLYSRVALITTKFRLSVNKYCRSRSILFEFDVILLKKETSRTDLFPWVIIRCAEIILDKTSLRIPVGILNPRVSSFMPDEYCTNIFTIWYLHSVSFSQWFVRCINEFLQRLIIRFQIGFPPFNFAVNE